MSLLLLCLHCPSALCLEHYNVSKSVLLLPHLWFRQITTTRCSAGRRVKRKWKEGKFVVLKLFWIKLVAAVSKTTKWCTFSLFHRYIQCLIFIFDPTLVLLWPPSWNSVTKDHQRRERWSPVCDSTIRKKKKRGTDGSDKLQGLFSDLIKSEVLTPTAVWRPLAHQPHAAVGNF